MRPVVNGLQDDYTGRIEFQVFAQLDKEAAGNDLATQHGVSAVPTMMLVAPDGKEIRRWVGTQPRETISAAFEQAAPLN
jgi:thioredoxin-like negative regulator of GroEL